MRKGGEIIFAAAARAPKGAGQPYRFVVFGDCGAGTAEQKAVAFQTYLARPDFVMITGDIVYSPWTDQRIPREVLAGVQRRPRIAARGAPLLRSTLVVAAPGNHDIATRDLEKYPDGLAYFLYWDQPRNGPLGTEGGPLSLVSPGPWPTGKRSSRPPAGPTPGWRTSRSTTAMPTGRSSTPTFTHKFISKVHSLTVADVNDTTLTVRQVSVDGAELDRFIVTK